MRNARALSCLLALLTVTAACNGGTTAPPPPAVPSLTGVWEAQPGDQIFGGLSSESVDLKFLELLENGSGQVYGTQATSTINACSPLVYAVVNTNVLSVSSGTLSDVFLASAELYTFTRPDANTLKITNDRGVTQTFTKAGAVAAAAKCDTANITAKLDGIAVNSASFANLLSDGTNLRLADSSGAVQTINPTTGALGTPETPGAFASSFTQIVTMQGGDYWAHCGCGGSRDIKRYKAAGPAFLDTVDTTTDLAKTISVRAAAFDGTNLWLGGSSSADNSYLLLKVNAEAEPDVLVSSLKLGGYPQAIAFLNGKLWALTSVLGPKLVQLDPTTGKATRTVVLPSPVKGQYQGLTGLGGKLFVLVRTYDSKSNILAVTP